MTAGYGRDRAAADPRSYVAVIKTLDPEHRSDPLHRQVQQARGGAYDEHGQGPGEQEDEEQGERPHEPVRRAAAVPHVAEHGSTVAQTAAARKPPPEDEPGRLNPIGLLSRGQLT